MEAQSQKTSGLNLNPLAPAQSKRTFAFSGKTQKIMGNAFISAPLFVFFFAPFSSLFQKSRKRGPVSGPRAIKIHQNGPQGCPNGAQESTN